MSQPKIIDHIPVHAFAGCLTGQAQRNRPGEAIITPLTPIILPRVIIQLPNNRINTTHLRGLHFFPVKDMQLVISEWLVGYSAC